MRASTPSEIYQLFGKYFSAGTIDLLLTLYEDDALLIPPAGAEARGKAAIREVIEGLLRINGEFSIGEPRIFQAGGVALLSAKWTLTGGRGPDGQQMDLSGQTSDVIREQPDGSWLFVIDSPFGIASNYA